jgi:hypothetical protein
MTRYDGMDIRWDLSDFCGDMCTAMYILHSYTDLNLSALSHLSGPGQWAVATANDHLGTCAPKQFPLSSI